MLLLPSDILAVLAPFAPLFSRPVWRHVQVLVVGAILAPGRRLVSTVLRAVGLSHLPTFRTYHRVLNRAVWSSLGPVASCCACWWPPSRLKVRS